VVKTRSPIDYPHEDRYFKNAAHDANECRVSEEFKGEEKRIEHMASKNKKFNVKHMGGNVDRKESEQVTKDYEVCVLFWKFLLSLSR